MAIVLALVILVNVSVYACTDANCRDRGGHTEMIWGSRIAWTCVEAEPMREGREQ